MRRSYQVGQTYTWCHNRRLTWLLVRRLTVDHFDPGINGSYWHVVDLEDGEKLTVFDRHLDDWEILA